MRFVALTLFAVVAALAATSGPSATAAPVPKHLMKEPESDKGKLQGQWKVESLRMGGMDALGGLGQKFDMMIEFRDDAFVATIDIGGTFQKSTATVAYGTSAARQVRMTNTRTVDRDGKPMNNPQQDSAFGYAFDGDKVLLASGSGGDQKAVDPLKPGPNDVVIILSRVKK